MDSTKKGKVQILYFPSKKIVTHFLSNFFNSSSQVFIQFLEINRNKHKS